MSHVFIVHAHPEPKSLNGALTRHAVQTLVAQGHTVETSDLYAMGWRATADADDFLAQTDTGRLNYARESKRAFVAGTQTADIAAEQNKLLRADAVILQFPLWWFSMPAILKGWVDRVYACGFAYGVGEFRGEKWGDRYGEGKLTGRRAMLSITVGGREPQYSSRGVNGSVDDLLFPIQHGILFYPGMDVLPPHVTYEVSRLGEERWPELAAAWEARLTTLFSDPPIPYRRQNGGHYDVQQVLKPGLSDGETGTGIHIVKLGEPNQHRQ